MYDIYMTKSEKLLKKTEKKIFRDFFLYDVIQERAWFRAFLTPIFNNFFRTAFKALEKQTLVSSLVINLVSSFGNISKKPKGR